MQEEAGGVEGLKLVVERDAALRIKMTSKLF